MLKTIELAITGPRSLRDPRSREYAIQTMRSLKRFLESRTFEAKHVEKELKLIIEHKHWEVCGFATLDAPTCKPKSASTSSSWSHDSAKTSRWCSGK